MTSIEFIAQHLNPENLKIPIIESNTICSFTGGKIIKGVENKNLIKKTFTDHEYLKYSSDFSSVEAALCIEAVIPSEKGYNSLRNYSYLVTDTELKLLKREETLDTILSLKDTPFVLCVTYSNKKHTAYKSTLNYNIEKFVVTTDLGDVVIERKKLQSILPTLQKWYNVVEGKENTSTQPTYFTKAEILNGSDNIHRIRQYGIEKYYRENAEIEKYRNTAFLNLIVHILNKKSNA